MVVPGASAGLWDWLGTSVNWMGNAIAVAAVTIADYTVIAGRAVADFLTSRTDPTPEYIADAVKREKQYLQDMTWLTTSIRNHTMFPYDRNHTRGDAGKILFIGGSDEFTGALYFGAITALRTGADVVYVITTEMAAPIIRRFSPDLRVYPYLNYDLEAVSSADGVKIEERIYAYETEKKGRYDGWTQDKLNETYFKNIQKIKTIIKRMDVVVIGLGMSKDDRIMPMFKIIVEYCREIIKPLVITHHGVYWLSRNFSLVQNWHEKGAIMVCNKRELLLFKHELERASYTGLYQMGKFFYYVMTGKSDYFLLNTTDVSIKKTEYAKINVFYMKHGGSGRRSAGQGHMLAGAVATFYNWAVKSPSYMIYHPFDPVKKTKWYHTNSAALHASGAGMLLIRKCNELAYARYGRSMITSNMIVEIHKAVEMLFEPNRTELRKAKPGHCEFDTCHEFGHIPVEDRITKEEIPSSTSEPPPLNDRARY